MLRHWLITSAQPIHALAPEQEATSAPLPATIEKTESATTCYLGRMPAVKPTRHSCRSTEPLPSVSSALKSSCTLSRGVSPRSMSHSERALRLMASAPLPATIEKTKSATTCYLGGGGGPLSALVVVLRERAGCGVAGEAAGTSAAATGAAATVADVLEPHLRNGLVLLSRQKTPRRTPAAHAMAPIIMPATAPSPMQPVPHAVKSLSMISMATLSPLRTASKPVRFMNCASEAPSKLA